jgi:hypothetical protein
VGAALASHSRGHICQGIAQLATLELWLQAGTVGSRQARRTPRPSRARTSASRDRIDSKQPFG